jgi:hypothetical protein
VRQAITLELVHALIPSEAKADQISTNFGLETVAHASIRENIEEHLVRLANELRDNLNDKAMAIFLQRSSAASSGPRTVPPSSTAPRSLTRSLFTPGF